MVEHQDGEHLTHTQRRLSASRVAGHKAGRHRRGSEIGFHLQTEIVVSAEQFHDFPSIFVKVHKAKELSGTIAINSNRSLALSFV